MWNGELGEKKKKTDKMDKQTRYENQWWWAEVGKVTGKGGRNAWSKTGNHKRKRLG